MWGGGGGQCATTCGMTGTLPLSADSWVTPSMVSTLPEHITSCLEGSLRSRAIFK